MPITTLKPKVFVLSILYDSADYRSKDNKPHSKVFVFVSKDKCKTKLRKMLLKDILENMASIFDVYVPKEIKKHFSIRSDMRYYDDIWDFISDIEELPIDECLKWMSEEKRSECKWSYEIKHIIIK